MTRHRPRSGPVRGRGGASHEALVLAAQINAPQYDTQTITVIDYATAQAVVANDLTTNLRQVSDESFDTVPFFHLDPLDFARVNTPTDSHDMQISAFTLPLTTADMTLNDKVYVPSPSVGR